MRSGSIPAAIRAATCARTGSELISPLAAPDGFRVSEPGVLGGPQFGGRYLDVAEVGDEPRAPRQRLLPALSVPDLLVRHLGNQDPPRVVPIQQQAHQPGNIPRGGPATEAPAPETAAGAR
jgi:hypothetical protein